jgi:hypothetical protein
MSGHIAFRRALVVFILVAVAGCSTAAALYRDPATGQTKLCQQDTNAVMLWGFDTGYTACKDALERAGWVRQ